MNKFAVFDLDGTLYNTHLGVELLKKLSELGAIPKISQEEFNTKYQEWLVSEDRTDYYDQYLDVYYNEHLKGVSQTAFNEVCQEIAKEVFDHTYKLTFDAMQSHKQNGYRIIIISKSPKQAVQAVTDRLGGDYSWGWDFYFNNGKYVGQYNYNDGSDDKRKIVESIVDEHELTLSQSFGYGDSRGDISILQLVENAVCINPDRFLLEAAQKNNWQVQTVTETYSHTF